MNVPFPIIARPAGGSMDASSISGTHLLPHIPQRTIRMLIISSEQLVHDTFDTISQGFQ
jgi:hypothetical protein